MRTRRARKRRERRGRRRGSRRPRVLFATGAGVVAAAALCWSFLRPVVPSRPEPPTDPREAELFRRGEALYAQHCASCHGASLEGETDWRRRRPDGSYPAPPHDGSGHTWHHPDSQLLGMVRDGGQRHAMPGFRSRMPAFRGTLSDEEILAILSFIKQNWSASQRAHQTGITRERDG